MKTPTLSQFKHFARASRSLVLGVVEARVFAEMERERVDGYITPIFASFALEYGAMGNRCNLVGPLESKTDLYLVDDRPKLDAYYAACDVAHRAHGFTGPAGHCPALVAEHAMIQAEHRLIDAASTLFGIESHHLWKLEDRKKYLDLLIGAGLKGDA